MNKEEIYDEQISPLMEEIIKICKEHKIATLCTFEIPTDEDEGLRCTTSLPDETGEFSGDMRRAVEIVRSGSSVPPMNLTVTRADGSKTLTSIHV